MAKIRGISSKIVEESAIALPTDIADASAQILSYEYKPITIFANPEDPNDSQVETHYLSSPSILDVIQLKQHINFIVKKLNPANPCDCAYTMGMLQRKEFSLQHGELLEEGGRSKSIGDLEAEIQASKGVLAQLKRQAKNQDTENTEENILDAATVELIAQYQQTISRLEVEVNTRKESLKKVQADLKKFPDGMPYIPDSLKEVKKCPHCKKEVPVPPMVVILDDDTYDKLCHLLLGVSLEEAGKLIPISQLKYIWAYTVDWVFAIPKNLPDPFTQQIQNAMSMLAFSDRMKTIMGITDELEASTQNFNPSGISGTTGRET